MVTKPIDRYSAAIDLEGGGRRKGCGSDKPTIRENAGVAKAMGIVEDLGSPPSVDEAQASWLLGMPRRWVRSVVEEAVEPIVKKLLPVIVSEVKSILEAQGIARETAVYISIKKAAEIMNAHPATVRGLIREGKLGSYSLKSEKRVKVSDIHVYMAREVASSPIISVDERARAIMSRRQCG